MAKWGLKWVQNEVFYYYQKSMFRTCLIFCIELQQLEGLPMTQMIFWVNSDFLYNKLIHWSLLIVAWSYSSMGNWKKTHFDKKVFWQIFGETHTLTHTHARTHTHTTHTQIYIFIIYIIYIYIYINIYIYIIRNIV